MEYDVKVEGEDKEVALLELERMAHLANSLKEIATKAFMLRFFGISDFKPDSQLKKALHIRFDKIIHVNDESTALTFECDKFAETLKYLQYDVFNDTLSTIDLTPMALVIQSFNAALNPETAEIELDKALTKALLNFKKNFVNKDEVFYFSNRGTVPEVRLTNNDFKRISTTNDKIPNPTNTIISGKLDEVKYSKSKLGIITQQGLVNVIDNEGSLIPQLLEFIGKDVTVLGVGHYKVSGSLSHVVIKSFQQATGKHKLFGQPSAVSAKVQLGLFQEETNKRGAAFEALKNVYGMLEHDISDGEMQEFLEDLHR